MGDHQGDVSGGSSSSGAHLLSRIALNDNKAGMEGLDRDKINKIILEASKGSKFYENELKKERQVNQRIEKMMEQKSRITKDQMKQAQAEVDKLKCELERGRELGRVIIHVDMDAFYAAVEMRDCPELKDKPMAVGSMSMLSTSNYHARRFGVRAAMPGFIAKKLCPNLVIMPTNFDKYRAVSAQVREIFSEYDPHFMPVSLDEAYLDITEHLEQRKDWPETMRTHHMCYAKTGAEGKAEVFGTSAEEAVREMRFRIEQKTSLTASAGIAPNMMLAKVCSDKNKPNGQYRIPPDRQVVMEFIKDLPVRKVSGVGKVTEKMLAALGIVSCAQLGQQMALLSLLFSETSWHHFLHISLGLGSTYIERDSERKSMSTERTFGEMNDVEEQYSLCRELCHDLAQDLQREGLKGKTVTLKLKNVLFEVKTRAFTLQYAVCTEEDIFAAAKDLLKVEIESVSPQPLKLRLMGVRVSGFISVEDKKPLQRSIMGFLQKGGSDPGSFTQCPGSALKAEGGSDSASFLKPQSVEMKVPSVSEQIPKSTEPKQQSFFQRAQSKRLQQQQQEQMSVIADTDETNRSADAAASTLPMTNPQSDTTAENKTSLSNTNATGYINKSPTLKPSFKISTQVLQFLTCPVCNKEMKDVNLTAFNHHIDECLKGGAMGNERTDSDAAELNSEPTASSLNPSCNGEKPSTSISLPGMETDDQNDFKTPFFSHRTKRNENSLVVPNMKRPLSESSSKASHTTRNPEAVPELSSDLKGSSLTCPVCGQLQSTGDLTLFNRHVDMCLNQEVLLEFRGSHPPADHSDAPALKSIRGQLGDQGRVSKVREKSKRQGSSLPPAKKTKVLSTKHTIDKFFKGNTRQND
ncbi:DNA polymerase kappa isoform X2 [Pseudorasbora parva]|uniref:DNA polymerase kappa isoform X2 n=1 Tax=Pseudorasbora parva TaxID=51549 RepID=UPI00351EBB8F